MQPVDTANRQHGCIAGFREFTTLFGPATPSRIRYFQKLSHINAIAVARHCSLTHSSDSIGYWVASDSSQCTWRSFPIFFCFFSLFFFRHFAASTFQRRATLVLQCCATKREMRVGDRETSSCFLFQSRSKGIASEKNEIPSAASHR